MAVLLLFNLSTTYTVNQLQTLTNIDATTLNQLLQLFLKSRILLLTSGGEESQQAAKQPDDETVSAPPLLPESEIIYNANYNKLVTLAFPWNPHHFFYYFSKRVRVNLNLPMKSETKQEAETTLSNVECDRKLGIQVSQAFLVVFF